MNEAVVFFTDMCYKAFLYAHLMGRSDRQVTLAKYEQMVTSENYKRLLYLSSKKIRILNQNITTYHHFIKEEKELFIHEGKVLLQLCIDKKQNFTFTREVIVGFIVNLGIAAARFYNKKLFADCIQGLQKFKNEINDPENHAYVLAESCLSDLKFAQFLLSADFENALKSCEQHLKKENIKDDALNDNLVIFYINKSLSHFLLEQFPEAVKALNAIELYTEKYSHPYADSEFYLIKILSHLEMGHSDAAFYIAKAYKNLLEKETLNFFQRKILVDVIIKNPIAEKREIARLTIDRLKAENITEDKCYDQLLIDITIWCRCALSNISLTQEYKKEYRRLYHE